MRSAVVYDASGRAVDIARKVLEVEIEGIRSIMDTLDDRFDACIDLLYALRGRIIITGVGKSGLIGRKIAATFTSTGSPAIFVHPVEGLHGDVGIVTRDDALLAISNSGETVEITSLAATIKSRGASIVALTGRESSTLAKMADLTLLTRVAREACPLNLAPTASTTATLSLGDAVAVALMVRRGIKEEDFLGNHPAGSLGERLNLTVAQMMLDRRAVPEAPKDAPLGVIISAINQQNLGLVLVTEDDEILGVITDGDLRRRLGEDESIHRRRAHEIMTKNPMTIKSDRTAAEALEIMESRLITALAVVNEEGRLSGLIHLHDLLGRGEVRFTP